MPAVPESLDEVLTPAWLTRALGQNYPGLLITKVEPGPIVSRVSTNARFTIECEGGLPEGLPPHLCVKGYFGEGAAARRAGIPEAYFYRDLAGPTGIRTLRSVYAEVDPETQHGVIITHDVAAEGGSFLDTETPYSADQVAESLDQLAVLHGTTHMKSELADEPWLTSRMAFTLQARGLPEINANFDGPNGLGVPDPARDAERLLAAYRSLADEIAAARPWSVIHGDTHVGNVFLDSDDRPCFLDWQCVQRGSWYVDVGYHIASSLDVEDRRRSEDDLLKHYLDRLGAYGIDLPTWDDARAGIRRGMLHGFFLWAITCKVKPAVIAVLLHRLGSAVADHDAFASVPA